MEFPRLFLVGFTIIMGMMTALWLLSLALRNASIVDIFWGCGFVIVNFVGFCFSGQTLRQILLTVLVTVWGLRLAAHIFRRNRNKPEDFRYARWRMENGPRWWWVSYFKVFVVQGVLLSIIAAPLLAVQASGDRQAFTVPDTVGVVVALIGFFFEAVGDAQLARFKADPAHAGMLMTSGLWRYTRHPNYFGDAAQWWGFFILAAAAGAWYTVISPLLMTVLLLRVSGVTLLENTLKERPGYEEYMRATNAFFPGPPRRQ
ncbi:MAG TPA: DUF1295 domain-containing protein [Bacteroidota bacterium]|nr:DUF1295 domain-containing protein [Bacteroidota bacterium]